MFAAVRSGGLYYFKTQNTLKDMPSTAQEQQALLCLLRWSQNLVADMACKMNLLFVPGIKHSHTVLISPIKQSPRAINSNSELHICYIIYPRQYLIIMIFSSVEKKSPVAQRKLGPRHHWHMYTTPHINTRITRQSSKHSSRQITQNKHNKQIQLLSSIPGSI